MSVFILTLHIIGAFVMGLLAIVLLLSLFRNEVIAVEKYTRFLAWNLGFELISGSLLTILAPEQVSLLHFCQNVSLYLFVSGVLFLLSALRIKEMFPRTSVLVPIMPSFIVVTSTAISLL